MNLFIAKSALVQSIYVSAVGIYGTKERLRNLMFIIINHVTKTCCLSAIFKVGFHLNLSEILRSLKKG